MKRLALGLSVVSMWAALLSAQAYKFEDSFEQPFSEDGKINLDLASGSYVVRGATTNRIRVHWQSDKGKDIDKIKTRITTQGTDATVRVDGPARNAEFIIEVPRRSDLRLRMKAGEMHIEGVEGNKDIKMTAGELTIDAEPDAYSRVHASVTFGDLDGSSFRIQKSGIARSFDWQGLGAYTLRASLFAGELKITKPRATR